MNDIPITSADRYSSEEDRLAQLISASAEERQRLEKQV